MTALFILAIVCLLNIEQALCSESCACATTGVHVRDGAGTEYSILTTLQRHHCLPYKHHHQQDSHSASWANVEYNGQSAWIHESYIQIELKSSCSESTSAHASSSVTPLTTGCPTIVSRAEWGARSPTHVTHLTHTPKYMFIHHGESAACNTKSECISRVKSYQNYHMDGHGWSDIGYSFLVGEDGNVYEGRGWDRVGAHTQGYNSVGLAICFIGNFMNHTPNSAALTAAQQLISCAVDNHKLTSTYILRGHRDMGSTDCPGDSLYNLIRTWPHY